MSKHYSQGRTLIEQLKSRPMTYREMLNASPSMSPWKRIKESLKPGESVQTGQTLGGLTTWSVVNDKETEAA